jgi:large repetitive protein
VKYFAAILLLLYTSFKAAAQNDCVDAITVCGSMNYTGLHASGFGIQELNPNNPCHSWENNSIWFKLKIKDGGTLGFILTPESTDIFVDYDFWIFGPNVSCGALGSPIRCSTTNPFTSGGTDNLTGMNATELDNHEGPNHLGNQFIKQMDVLAGEEYYMIVDRPHGDANFSIQWTGTASFFEAPYFDNPLNISLDMGVCDTDGQTDGNFLYDLTLHRSMLIGPQTGVVLTYHLDSGDAITGDNPIPNPEAYTTIADPQVIHMRMTNTITGCYEVQTFVVDTGRPDFENPQPIDLNLHACDDDGVIDQKHVFDLAQHEAVFLGSRPTVSVAYYETEANAYAQTNPVAVTSPYINTTNPQTFYIRLDDSASGCYNVQPFTMEVHPLPVFNNPDNISLDLIICDQDGTADGVTNFDLTQHWVMLTGGDFNLFIKYYKTLNDANNDTNEITDPFWYLNITQSETIYMRLENAQTGCYSIGSFNVEVLLPPVYNNPQNISLNLEACDNGSFEGVATFNLTTHAAMLINGRPNHIIKYYRENWEAMWDMNALSTSGGYTNTSNPQMLYMRLENTITGCYSLLSFTLTAIPAPVFNNPQNISLNLTACDDDGITDGRHLFNLSQHELMLKGSQPNAIITYHTTATDAEAGTAGIANPANYLSLASPQTIYVRIEDSVTECYNTSNFTLTVYPLPHFSNPQNLDINLTECDQSGNNSGTAVFNLTTHNQMLTSRLAGKIITYHTTQGNAETGINEITNPLAYTNIANPQTIFMRLTDTATGCHNIGSFMLNVILPPVFNNPQNINLDLETCDDTTADGLAQFDLTVHQAMLLGTQTGAIISYHFTQQEAQAGNNLISNPSAFSNTQNPQTIYMRIEHAATDCYSTEQFNVTVNPLPVFNNPQSISLNPEECDADSVDDQSYIFNLDKHISLLKDNQDVSVSFYTSQANADAGISAISNTSAFRNTVNPQIIYIRFTNNATGCYSILPFTITVTELLDAGNPDDLYLCDDYETGQNIFNLALNDAAMKNGQPNTSVSYYSTLQDAQNRTNRLPSQYQNIQPYTQQTIWARLDNVGGCWGHDIKSFTINILQLPDIEFTFTVSDFTYDQNSISVNIANPENFMYSLDGLTFQESPVFTDLKAGLYTVYIRSLNRCKTVNKEVVVLNYPKFFSPNNDGHNDNWHIPFISRFPKSKIYIFDRYGKLITGYNGMHPGWDGTYNGNRLPATDYWFVLELEDGRTIKSHFSLIR